MDSCDRIKRSAARKRPSAVRWSSFSHSEIGHNIFFRVATSTVFRPAIHRISTLSLADTSFMLRVFYRAAGLLCIAVLVPSLASARPEGSQAPQSPTPARVAEPRAAATQLRSVGVTKIDGGYSITLSADGPLFASNVAESKDLPPRVVVDFERVSPGAAPAITTINDDGIDRVRVSTHSRNPLITRVVIDLSRRIPFTVEQVGEDLRVLLKLEGDPLIAPVTRPEAKAIAMSAQPNGPPCQQARCRRRRHQSRHRAPRPLQQAGPRMRWRPPPSPR